MKYYHRVGRTSIKRFSCLVELLLHDFTRLNRLTFRFSETLRKKCIIVKWFHRVERTSISFVRLIVVNFDATFELKDSGS